MAVCGDDVHPVRVVRSDEDGERSLGFGGLHKLLAQDRALVLALFRGLKEWEHGRQCSELRAPRGPKSPLHGHTWGRQGGWGVRMQGFGGGWEVARQGR